MPTLPLQIEDVFADTSATDDPSGALSSVFEQLSALGPTAVFISDDAGRVLATYAPFGHASPLSAAEAAGKLAPLLATSPIAVTGCAAKNGAVHSVLGLRIPEHDGQNAFLGAVVNVLPHDFAPSTDWKRGLSAAGALAWTSVRLSNELGHVGTRIKQLLAEQDTLRAVHAETVTAVLQEREDRIREKRDHILHLESEVRKRSAALQKARLKAEHASQAKSEFLANMSHEIRTPMTAILGFAEDLLAPDFPESDRLEAIRTIRRNGEHLLQIINDILDISKVEAGKLEVELIRVSPVKLFSEVQSLMQARAGGRGLTLDFEYVGSIPETIETDPTRLRQILINLVGNAVKFTETGGVRVVTRVAPPADLPKPMLQFDVIDTGIGMTPKQMEKLFQSFWQADTSTSRRFGGTGLGLAVSKRLAHILGGDIVAQSAPGKGSTFRVRVAVGSLEGVNLLDGRSLATVTKPQPEATATAETPRLEGRILLAEDGPDNQRLIALLLRRAGAEVVVAENGEVAVERALAARNEGRPFGVILMDMQMPVLDGYAATRQLRRAGYSGPIVALTAHAMTGDREACLAAGCDDFAAKPISRKDLFAVISKHLSSATGATS